MAREGKGMDSTNNSRPVQIRLHSSIQHPGQDKEQHYVQLTGRFIEKAQASFLKYDEEQNGARIQTTVKMSASDALIMRSGGVSMRLPFSIERERIGQYGNGPAQFKLRVQTSHIEMVHDVETGSGSFTVHYELLNGESSFGVYELTLTYTEGK